jgi:hypothetical protein
MQFSRKPQYLSTIQLLQPLFIIALTTTAILVFCFQAHSHSFLSRERMIIAECTQEALNCKNYFTPTLALYLTFLISFWRKIRKIHRKRFLPILHIHTILHKPQYFFCCNSMVAGNGTNLSFKKSNEMQFSIFFRNIIEESLVR